VTSLSATSAAAAATDSSAVRCCGVMLERVGAASTLGPYPHPPGAAARRREPPLGRERALGAGLLLLPQAAGMAPAMPLAGRLTDRLGGGRVAVGGLAVMIAGTLPPAAISDTTSYRALGACCWCAAWASDRR
jgi:MFS family permease